MRKYSLIFHVNCQTEESHEMSNLMISFQNEDFTKLVIIGQIGQLPHKLEI